MKKLAIIILFSVVNFAQSYTDPVITKMIGLNDSLGNTHLFYELTKYYVDETKDSVIYKLVHYDVNLGTHKTIFDGYYRKSLIDLSPIDIRSKKLADITFINNDPHNYVLLINYVEGKAWSVIKFNNETEILVTTASSSRIFSSSQFSNKIFVSSGGKTLISIDGGITWPTEGAEDSENILDYSIVGISPFSEDIFGVDKTGKLLKTFDGGNSTIIVNNDPIWKENTEIEFDLDRKSLYAQIKHPRQDDYYYDYEYYYSLKSDDNGNPFTWNIELESYDKILIANNNSDSTDYFNAYLDGGIYDEGMYSVLSSKSGSKIYQSDRIINGIFSSSKNELFIAHPNKIVSVNTGNLPVIIDRYIINQKENLEFLPLKVGNSWTYEVQGQSYDIFNPDAYHYYVKSEIVGTETIGGEKFYVFNRSVFFDDLIRIDSAEALLVGENGNHFNFTSTEYEKVFLEWGLFSRFEKVSIDTIFSKRQIVKEYSDLSLSSGDWKFAKGIGLVYHFFTYDFGEGTAELKGAVINGKLYGDTTVVSVEYDDIKPTEFYLSQNYPNPFNPTTSIEYAVPSSEYVTLRVYDILGNEVATLVNEQKSAGVYSVTFKAENLPSGVYIYQLRRENYNTTKKMLLLK